MTLVFTNGRFDLIHWGHVDLLDRARALGDRLVVGLNSDASVRAIRGDGRPPLVPQEARAAVLRSLRSVDEVMVFDEPTPVRLIEALKPNILVKGGDWPVDHIVGADIVRRHGGTVLSLPLRPGYSTTALVERIAARYAAPSRAGSEGLPAEASESPAAADRPQTTALRSLLEHQRAINALATTALPQIARTAEIISVALNAGRKLLLCGNGGSAADAQHIAAEFLGRFESDRRSYPAIALGSNPSTVTAISNDFGFQTCFARQVQGFGCRGDVLVAISTSGSSPNVLEAVMAARELGCVTIGLTGANGKKLASLCDFAISVPSSRTARIQEAHITIGHLWCELVDPNLNGSVPESPPR